MGGVFYELVIFYFLLDCGKGEEDVVDVVFLVGAGGTGGRLEGGVEF